MIRSAVTQPQYDDVYVQALFDRMGRTYDVVNLVSSFGFSALWRRQCVANLPIMPGARVCDMMAGTGECWTYALSKGAGTLISVDFSPVMIRRQELRRSELSSLVDVRCENALSTSIASESIDCVVCAFGLKTLNNEGLRQFAFEIRRILKPNGRFSLVEISSAENWFLGWLYRWYLTSIVPMIGKVCLGDIDCYRKLGVYTKAFGSCSTAAATFRDVGLETSIQNHFFGCASSLVGRKIE
jgi:demethylmenaquinone methyltransferase/2-methoxy-6-polyprenyl-1,4-benzoquinol methylase